jgi:single-strand DNA-binding protein
MKMSDLNKTTLAGRLVRSPVIHSTDNGTVVAFFVVAANYHYKGKNDNYRHEAAFVPCKAFGAWTEAVGSCEQGDKILVTGRLKTETRESDGMHQLQLILICESVHQLKTFKSERHLNGRTHGTSNSEAQVDGSDEIPF